MLLNTLILPANDAKLAASLLREAVEDLDVVLMLILGTEGEAETWVRWADRLCEKTRSAPGRNLRHVVWVTKPDVTPVREILVGMLGDARPRIAVLDFYDQVKATLSEGDTIRPLTLELAFLKGHGR